MAKFSFSLSNHKSISKRVGTISFLRFILSIIGFTLPFSYIRKSFPYISFSFSYIRKPFSYTSFSFSYIRKPFSYTSFSFSYIRKPFSYTSFPFSYIRKPFSYIRKPLSCIRKSASFINLIVNQTKNTIKLRTSQLRGYLIRIFVVGTTIAGVGGIVLTRKSISI